MPIPANELSSSAVPTEVKLQPVPALASPEFSIDIRASKSRSSNYCHLSSIVKVSSALSLEEFAIYCFFAYFSTCLSIYRFYASFAFFFSLFVRSGPTPKCISMKKPSSSELLLIASTIFIIIINNYIFH